MGVLPAGRRIFCFNPSLTTHTVSHTGLRGWRGHLMRVLCWLGVGEPAWRRPGWKRAPSILAVVAPHRRRRLRKVMHMATAMPIMLLQLSVHLHGEVRRG